MPATKAKSKEKTSKPSKKLRPNPKKARPLPTPYTYFFDGRPFLYEADLHKDLTCIQLSPMSPDTELSDQIYGYFRHTISSFASVEHELVGEMGLAFLTRIKTLKSYQDFSNRGVADLPGSQLRFRIDCGLFEDILDFVMAELGMSLEDVMSFENDPTGLSDFESPPTSDDEELKAKPKPNPHKTQDTGKSTEPPKDATSPKDAKQDNDTAKLTLTSAPADESGSSTDQQPADTVAMETEDPAQPQKPRRRRGFRFKQVNFNDIIIEAPASVPVQTVLFRPLAENTKLSNLHPVKLTTHLQTLGKYREVRDIRGGGIAVDFEESTDLEPVLATTSILKVQVTASLPAGINTTAGVIRGVHPDLTDAEILSDIQVVPSVPVAEMKRLAKPGQKSWVLQLRFQGKELPERVLLYGRSHRVEIYNELYLQCAKCSRFGHTTKSCRSKARCRTCAEDHETTSCTKQASPSCGNCNGAHPANSPTCPAREFHNKIYEVRRTHQVSFTTAKLVVSKAAKSYAEALKKKEQPKQATSQPVTKPSTQPKATTASSNIAHPRPPVAQVQPDLSTLAALFHKLQQIIQQAVQSNNINGIVAEMAAAFAGLVPEADPAIFQASN